MDKFKYIQIEQPIGTMFMGAMRANDVYDISKSYIRSATKDGIQRDINESRVRSIAEYCEDPDAIFPTPIILSGKSDCVKFDFENNEIEFNEKFIKNGNLFSIVDGQHRLEGIKRARKENSFILPVIIIFDTTNEQDAYLFSVINGNQKPVSKSLVYDLFDLSLNRSIEKSCNYIVRSLNSTEGSPLYKKVKMLGVKTPDTPEAKVSQATIIRNIIPFISKDPSKDNLALKMGHPLEKLDSKKYIFRDLFVNSEESAIFQILHNYFKAFDFVINKKFDNNTKEFFEKTIGMTSKIFTLRPLYFKANILNNYKTSFFANELEHVLNVYKNIYGDSITSKEYGSSDSDAKKLYFRLIQCWCSNNIENIIYCNLTELRNAFNINQLELYFNDLPKYYNTSDQLKEKYSRQEFDDFMGKLELYIQKQKQATN